MRKTSYVKDLKIIRDLVESHLGVNISCRSRKREVVYGRAIYYQLARDFTPHPLALIGGEINKDHASVLHGLKTFKNFRRWNEKQLISIYHTISRKLNQNIFFDNSIRNKSDEQKFEFLLHHYITLKQKYQEIKSKLEKIS